MITNTFKTLITKVAVSASAAALCIGCMSGFSFAARPSGAPAAYFLDMDTDVLSLVMETAAEKMKSPYETMVVSNVEPYLPVYAESNTASDIIGELKPGTCAQIVEKGPQWIQVTSGDISGFVPAREAATGDAAKEIADIYGIKYVKVNVDTLNIRTSPSTEAEVIASGRKDDLYRIVPEGSEYDESADTVHKAGDPTALTSARELMDPITDPTGRHWYRITLGSSYYGYVCADCVSIENVMEGISPHSDRSFNVSEDEAYLLACIVSCEAGNQSYECRLAVANVVLNRVLSERYPNTIREVVYQSGQFGPAFNGSLSAALSRGPIDGCMDVAKDALAGNNNIEDYLYFNNYAPSNADVVHTIGALEFYNYN